MKTNNMRTVIISLATVAVMAMGANAFAGKGMGNQDNRRECGGCGSQNRMGGSTYDQMNANLTPEQREQMEAERQAFFNTTKNERQDLYAKRLELKAEMAKRETDAKKASALQKDISELKGNLDQKRLSHILAMRKINPDAGRGWMMTGRGKGHHGKGQGMGYGPGNCPNQ